MLKRYSLLVLLCAALLAACAELPLPGGAATAEPPTVAPTVVDVPKAVATATVLAPLITESGIEGFVTIGPNCPVMRVDTPCPDAPLQATLSVLNAKGAAVAEVQSDMQGYFKVTLPPGAYTLQPQANKIQHAAEQQVTVTAGQFISVTVQYDSGIR
jgi:hypothetical protein